MTMRVTIKAADVRNTYGQLYATGSVQTVSDEYGRDLVQSGRALDTDGAFLLPPNDAFLAGDLLGNAAQTPAFVDPNGKPTLPLQARIGGAHIGFFGASLEMWNYPIFSLFNAGYTRSRGVVTLTIAAASGLMQRFRGHEIHVASKEVPDVEGIFTLTANTSDDGSFTLLTYLDPRPDRTLAAGLGVNVMDRHAWSFTGGAAAYMCAALGARVRSSGMGISGSEIFDLYRPDFSDKRIELFLSKGPYDAVVMWGGGLGNSVASADKNTGAADLIEQVSKLVLRLAASGTKAICFSTVTVSRGTLPTDQKYTRGNLTVRGLYSEIARRHPFVRIVQFGEAMGTAWQASPSVTPSDDVLYGYPPAEWMAADGVHQAQREAMRMGVYMARALNSLVQDWVPYTGLYADTRVINTVADKDGTLNPSVLPTWYGNVATAAITATGVTGVGPTGITVAWGARGGAACVGSMVTELEGGSAFQLAVTDTAPSAQGGTMTVTWQPAELLAALNSTEFSGALVDLYMPLEIKGFAEGGVRHCELLLVGIAGDGVARLLAAPLFDQAGDHTMVAEARHLGDEGLAGVFRAPRVRLPSGITYTSVRLIWTVRHVGSGDTPGGPVAYTVLIGPQTRLEIIRR